MTEITDGMLHAFVDGQLDDADMALVEAYLNRHPERALDIENWSSQNAAIRALFPASKDQIPIPVIKHPAAANTVWAPLRSIAAALLFVGVGVTVGWFGRGVTPPAATQVHVAGLVQDAISAHAVFSADAHRPVELGADQEDLLIHWLSARLGKQLTAPDLSANGYELVGGRLLSVDQGPAAQFMYENADGVRITLFAARSDTTKLAQFTYKQDGDTSSFHWQDEHLSYALVGKLPREDLNALAIHVYEAYF